MPISITLGELTLKLNMLGGRQEIFAPAAWHQSFRADVSTAHLPPWRIRQEGVKYADVWSENATTVRLAIAVKLARDFFGPLVK